MEALVVITCQICELTRTQKTVRYKEKEPGLILIADFWTADRKSRIKDTEK